MTDPARRRIGWTRGHQPWRVLPALVALAACQRGVPNQLGDIKALEAAVKAGNVVTVRALLEKRPGLARIVYATRSPAHRAANIGNAEMLGLFLDAGTDPRDRDVDGATLMHDARSVAVAELLLARGARIDSRTHTGGTPLMSVLRPEMTEWLLAHGARPQLRDDDGQTALHHEARRGSKLGLEATAMLCAAGADPDQRDLKGQTPRDLARNLSGDWSAVEAAYLKPAGPCDRLRAQAKAGARVGADELRVTVHDAGCAAGDLYACGHLGYDYENGRGVPKDLARAAAIYRAACEKKYAWSCSALGYAYRNGEGVAKDDAQAVALFRQACDGGYANGCAQLAWNMVRGRGIARDPVEAAKLFARACAAGEKDACPGGSLLARK